MEYFVQQLINGLTLRSGGKNTTRAVDGDDEFEHTLDELFNRGLAEDQKLAEELWAALANIEWRKGEQRILYSFRAAGDVVAALLGEGTYLDWYCCATPAVVSRRVADALLSRGWAWVHFDKALLTG